MFSRWLGSVVPLNTVGWQQDVPFGDSLKGSTKCLQGLTTHLEPFLPLCLLGFPLLKMVNLKKVSHFLSGSLGNPDKLNAV